MRKVVVVARFFEPLKETPEKKKAAKKEGKPVKPKRIDLD